MIAMATERSGIVLSLMNFGNFCCQVEDSGVLARVIFEWAVQSN